MTLDSTPKVARWLALLAVPLFGLPCLALTLSVLAGLRAESTPSSGDVLAAAAVALATGLTCAGFIVAEALAYLLGSRLLRPAALLGQIARDAAAQDFRHAPPSGGTGELGRLATAFGRVIRHLSRRRRELDWLAADTAGQGFVEGAAERARRLLAQLTRDAAFATDDPEPAEAWLDLPLHRLLCGLAAGTVVLAAAPAGPAWAAPVAAVALLGGRALDRLRRLIGAALVWIGVAAALAVGWLTGLSGPGFALAAALAASLAVHAGGGWRGPTGSAADADWVRGGLAGAVAGAGAAMSLVATLGMEAGPAGVTPAMLVALGLAATCLAAPASVAMSATWPGPYAAWRALRQASAGRVIIGGALPAGIMLGAAIGLVMGEPLPAILAALAASLFLALPRVGPRSGRVRLRVIAGGLLTLGLLLGSVTALPLLLPLLTVAAAVLAWCSALPPETGGAAPKQLATMAALARSIGLVAGLAGAALLPPPLSVALMALAFAWLVLAGARLPSTLLPGAAPALRR